MGLSGPANVYILRNLKPNPDVPVFFYPISVTAVDPVHVDCHRNCAEEEKLYHAPTGGNRLVGLLFTGKVLSVQSFQ